MSKDLNEYTLEEFQEMEEFKPEKPCELDSFIGSSFVFYAKEE